MVLFNCPGGGALDGEVGARMHANTHKDEAS